MQITAQKFVAKMIILGMFIIGAFIMAPLTAFATPLVSAAWLSEQLDDENIIVIDLRNKIDNGNYETFLEGYIPGAIHSNYLTDGWRVAAMALLGCCLKQKNLKA